LLDYQTSFLLGTERGESLLGPGYDHKTAGVCIQTMENATFPSIASQSDNFAVLLCDPRKKRILVRSIALKGNCRQAAWLKDHKIMRGLGYHI
jgi:hypothetical protein